MFPPNSASQKCIPDGNTFAPLALLHRRTRPVGKASQRGNYSWWKHLGGSLEFVESALYHLFPPKIKPGDYCVKAGWRARDYLSLAQVASKKNALVRSTSVCTIAARCERLQLGMPWGRCQSWPPFKSLPSRHTQNCSTLQSHHVRPWPSMFPPNTASQKFIPDGNTFAPLAFLHRRTRPVGKAFQRGNYSWWKHLGGSLEFVESALQPGDYCVKAGWRARDYLSLAQVASKKKCISPFHFCLHHCS